MVKLILKIRLRAKHPQIEAMNMLEADSLELAELIRKLGKENNSEKREGTFTLHSFNYDTAILELEFK
jgi:hypothetical protein